jgi:hypothetical protein
MPKPQQKPLKERIEQLLAERQAALKLGQEMLVLQRRNDWGSARTELEQRIFDFPGLV